MSCGDTDETPRIPLSMQPLGIESFRIEGDFGTEAVRAHWDGQWVWASRILWAGAQVGIAVDELFVEAGIEAGCPWWAKGSPEELMLAMITCCERIDVAEFELRGHRRVVSR